MDDVFGVTVEYQKTSLVFVLQTKQDFLVRHDVIGGNATCGDVAVHFHPHFAAVILCF